MKLTVDLTNPQDVAQVGDKLVAKGYNEARWTTMLDDAGYPKAPAPRRTPASGPRSPEPPPRAETQAATLEQSAAALNQMNASVTSTAESPLAPAQYERVEGA